MAEMFLDRRQYRMAAQMLRQALEKDPGKPSLEVMLGRALAGIGRCSQAVDLLERNRTERAYGYRAARAASDCFDAMGREAEGVYFLEEAILLNSDANGLGIDLADLAMRGGDPGTFAQALALAEAEGLESIDAHLVRAMGAFGAGDHDLLWEEVRWLDRSEETVARAAVLEGQAWLELDDPLEAARALEPVARRHPYRTLANAWLAEANRRAGSTQKALELLQTRKMQAAEHVLLEAMAIRAQADFGADRETRERAEGLVRSHGDDREVVATAWYVARASGDPERAADLQAQYARLGPAGRFPLDLLVPWERRSSP
jgi:lipopolysaccharide biosynthesis regulator YciM